MAEMPIFGSNRESGAFNDILAQHGAPAFVRRARLVQQAWDALVECHRRRRDEYLTMVRTFLAVLRALAGHWSTLRPWLVDDEQLTVLDRLEADLHPRLRQPLEPTQSAGKLRRALRELVESLQRFNRRWTAVLAEVDFAAVNELREGYNRFYVLEKELALRSARLTRQGFWPLAPATTTDLAAALPLLPVPVLAG
jgi:adenosyl cobinamide kinase/adenosyl cobinamide phosphate guanylyltransferase